MKKKILITLFSILAIVAIAVLPIGISLATERLTACPSIPSKDQLKEGDIIFNYSTSNQSSLIAIGTQSYVTHCGIIVFRNGKPMVYEAARTVKLTPLKNFINRSRDGRFWIKRTNIPIRKIKTKYLDMPYDIQFKFNNGKMYCSELIYLVYKEQFGVELCKPKKVSDYLILGSKHIPKLKKEIAKRGISMNQEAVAPVDIFNSPLLENIDF